MESPGFMEVGDDGGEDPVAGVGDAVPEVADGIEDAEFTVVEDADVIGEAFGGFEDLSGEEDGAPAGGGVTGFGAEEGDALGIHAGGEGFVEEPEFWVDEEEGDERDLVGLAAGEGFDGGFGVVQEVEGAEPVDHALGCFGSVGTIDPEDESEAADEGFGAEVGREVGKENDAPTEFEVFGGEGLAVEGEFPVVRADEASEAAQEGGLAGAIGTEDGDDLTWGERDGDAVEGAGASVGLGDGGEFDVHVVGWRLKFQDSRFKHPTGPQTRIFRSGTPKRLVGDTRPTAPGMTGEVRCGLLGAGQPKVDLRQGRGREVFEEERWCSSSQKRKQEKGTSAMRPKTSVRQKAVATEPVSAVPEAAGVTRRVLFDVHLGGAREVYLAGTFNDWHPTTLPMVDMGLGRWEKEILVPPGVYEYLFVADGRWIPDPECPVTVPNPHGGVNCVRRVS